MRQATPLSFWKGTTAQGFNWDGGRLRYGLTIDELAYIQRRITEILAKVDSGKLRVYRARRSP